MIDNQNTADNNNNTTTATTTTTTNGSRRVSSIAIVVILGLQFILYTNFLSTSSTSSVDSNHETTPSVYYYDELMKQQTLAHHFSNKQRSIEYYEELNRHTTTSIDALLDAIYHDLYTQHSPIQLSNTIGDHDHDDNTDGGSDGYKDQQLNHLLHPQKYSDENVQLLTLLYQKQKSLSQQQQQFIHVGNENDNNDNNDDIQSLRDQYLKELLNDQSRLQFLKHFNTMGNEEDNDSTHPHVTDVLNLLHHSDDEKFIHLLHRTRFQRLTMNMYERRQQALRRVTNFFYSNDTEIPFQMDPKTSNLLSGSQCTFFYVYLIAAFPEYRKLWYSEHQCARDFNKCNLHSMQSYKSYYVHFTENELIKSMLTSPQLPSQLSYRITFYFSTDNERCMHHLILFVNLWQSVMRRLNIVRVKWLDICYEAQNPSTFQSNVPLMQIQTIQQQQQESQEQKFIPLSSDVQTAIPHAIYDWLLSLRS